MLKFSKMIARHKSIYSKFIYLIVFLFLFEGFINSIHAMTTEEEKKLGKKILLEMERKIEWVRDIELQNFLNQIGQSIVAQAGPTPFEFKFHLIKSSDPNAYAIPGGNIFVTTGLILLAESEQEVAGVLSHEVSHVIQRHVAQIIDKAKRLNIASMAAIIAGVILGGGGKASEAVATTAMATAEALVLKYTREMETEADQNSIRYMIKAGYDPNGLITFLNKIYKLSLTSSPKIPTYLLTHPAIGDRISLLENLLQIGSKPEGPFKKIENFKRIQVKTFVEEREPNVALTHFQSIIDPNPQDLDGLLGLGLAYKKMGRLDKSMEVLERARSIAPEDMVILRELGIIYFLSGRLDQAITNLENVYSAMDIRRGHEDPLNIYYLGRGYQEKGNFSKALPLLLKVQKMEPEFIDVYHSLGSIYGRMGQKGISHFYFGKYFKLRGDRKNALLHFRTALEWLEKGSPERDNVQQEIKELTSPNN